MTKRAAHTLRTRLLLLAGGMAVGLGAMSALVIVQGATTERQVKLVAKANSALRAHLQADGLCDAIRADVFAVLMSRSEGAIETSTREFGERARALRLHLSRASPWIDERPLEWLHRESRAQMSSYLERAASLVEVVETDRLRAITLLTEVLDLHRQTSETNLRLTDRLEALVEEARGNAEREVQRFNRLALAASAVVLALVSLSAWSIVKRIGRSLAALRRKVESVAEGDLRGSGGPHARDELGELAIRVDEMTSSLRSMVESAVNAVERVEETAKAIAEDSHCVHEASEHQVTSLEEATRSMETIHQRVRGISGSADALTSTMEGSASAIQQLRSSCGELAVHAASLSDRVNESTTSVRMMSESGRQIAESAAMLGEATAESSDRMNSTSEAITSVSTGAHVAAELASRVMTTAERGREREADTLRGVQAVQQAAEAARQRTGRLAERTRAIGTIVEVIDDVAHETTLLALNAAIIAAQSGEQGRAFAVVAGQIKELAGRVTASTKEISELVHTLQRESGDTLEAITSSFDIAEREATRAAEAGASLNEITEAAVESRTQSSRIVDTLRRETEAMRLTLEDIGRLREGVEQIGDTTKEQDRGNASVLHSCREMESVATFVQRTSDEQARTSESLAGGVEQVHSAVSDINDALRQQATTCDEAAALLNRISELARGNEKSVGQVDERVQELLRDGERLHEQVRRFRI